MTELSELLERLGLLQYLGRLNEEGFDRWETVLDITEQDLAALGFKLGHRRVLQREIASARGIAPNQALTPAQFGPLEDNEQDEKAYWKTAKQGAGKTQPSTGKRKYRRHPKADENAPEKPPSAYVMFANRVRDELKGQNLTFTDIAKLVGEKWKVLAPEDKEHYELQASMAKDKFNAEFDEYKKTDQYKEYVKYLAEFKSKTAKDGKESTEQSELNQKRLKLENIPSSGSAGSPSVTGSIGSISSAGSMSSVPATAMTLHAPSGSPSVYSSPLQKVPSPPLRPVGLPSMNAKTPASPSKANTSIIDFAGYKEDGARETQPQQNAQSAAATTSADSHFFPRIHPTVQSPHIQQQSSYVRHQPTPQHTGPRNTPVLPSPGIRRAGGGRLDEPFSPLSMAGSISSSGSSSAPSATPLTPSVSNIEDTSRSNRSLPLPSPSTSGYFDQRTHHHHQRQPSQPQSPRSYSQQSPPQLPPPNDPHSRTYSPVSRAPLPRSSLPPPPTPRPPSRQHPD